MKPAWESGAGFGALAVAGVLALNYPLIALFDRDALVFGIPLPFLHVFIVWGLLIAGLALLVECHSRRGVRKVPPVHDELDSVNGVAAPVSRRPIDTED